MKFLIILLLFSLLTGCQTTAVYHPKPVDKMPYLPINSTTKQSTSSQVVQNESNSLRICLAHNDYLMRTQGLRNGRA